MLITVTLVEAYFAAMFRFDSWDEYQWVLRLDVKIGFVFTVGVALPAVPPAGTRTVRPPTPGDRVADDPAADPVPHLCARCAIELVPGRVTFYHVAVEATADPTPVPDPELSEAEVSEQLDRLFEEAQDTPTCEAMDQVRRRMNFCLCVACYRLWIEAPAG